MLNEKGKRAGAPKSGRCSPWPSADVLRAAKMIAAGATAQEISDATGRSLKAVHRFAQRHELQIAPRKPAPPPSDFSECAATMKRDALVAHYRTSTRAVARWRKQVEMDRANAPVAPVPVAVERRMNFSQEIVYAALDRAAAAGEYCPGNDDLAKACLLDGRSASAIIAQLAAMGMIRVQTGGSKRVVTIVATGRSTSAVLPAARLAQVRQTAAISDDPSGWRREQAERCRALLAAHLRTRMHWLPDPVRFQRACAIARGERVAA